MAKKVAEIREELINAGVDANVVNSVKGKSNLMELYKQYVTENPALLDEATDILNEVIDNETPKQKEKEDIQDSAENVMSLFRKNELQDGAPKVNGLRRVATSVIGPIYDENINIFPFEYKNSAGILTGVSVKFSITFLCSNSDYGIEGDKITFSDAADCIPGFNCSNPDYGKFMTSLATTRAEARVLRKALQLDTVAAEEIDSGEIDTSLFFVEQSMSKMAEAQKVALNKMCSNRGIELTDIIKEAGYGDTKLDDLESEAFHQCSKIIAKRKVKENE